MGIVCHVGKDGPFPTPLLTRLPHPLPPLHFVERGIILLDSVWQAI